MLLILWILHGGDFECKERDRFNEKKTKRPFVVGAFRCNVSDFNYRLDNSLNYTIRANLKAI